MKNLFKISSGLILGISIVVPLIISAAITAPNTGCTVATGTGINECELVANNTVTYDQNLTNGVTGSVCCLMSTIVRLTNWIFLILMAVAVIFVIIGGFFMITAAGNPEQFSKGRQFVIYALIGIVVALLAKFVPGIAKFIVG